MKLKVTAEGVIIPRRLLEGFEEVEIRKNDHVLVIVPSSKADPILELGKHPVICGLPDASEHHDKYL